MSYLMHYGVKGMKWGIRRYQNEDGTLTDWGKRRNVGRRNVIRNRPYTDDVNKIVRSMSKDDKLKLGASLHEDWIDKTFENETLSNIAKTILIKNKSTPISFVEIWSNDSRTGQIAIGTRSGDKYRGKGYATTAMDQAMEWANKYGRRSLDELEWWALSDNPGSNALANKFGFELTDKSGVYDSNYYNHYVKKLK